MSDIKHECQKLLMKAGVAYPRTCTLCGLGPCKNGITNEEIPGKLPIAAKIVNVQCEKHPIEVVLDAGLWIRMFNDCVNPEHPEHKYGFSVWKYPCKVGDTEIICTGNSFEECVVDLQDAIDNDALKDVGKPFVPRPI